MPKASNRASLPHVEYIRSERGRRDKATEEKDRQIEAKGVKKKLHFLSAASREVVN
jgi:hypothetical protein